MNFDGEMGKQVRDYRKLFDKVYSNFGKCVVYAEELRKYERN